MLPSRMAGGMALSSSSSGIFFEGDGQSQADGYSQLNSTFRNSANSLSGHGRPSVSLLSGNVNNTVVNSVPSSGPSIGASSLVTDANSGLSPGPHLQRSASSINTESYTRLPASPMSFSSNNINMDGSNQDPGSQRALLNQQHLGASSSTPFSTSHMGQVQLYGGQRAPNSFIQDPISQLQKKPHLDMKQENVLQHHVMQLLQRQDSMYSQSPNPQLQALIQQQRLRQQQQQLLQSMTPMQRVQFLQQQQQHQQQQRQQLPQQGQQQAQPASGMKRPHDAGVCSRRLMQYLYHQRQRPADNAIAYWRKFVSEYYSPRAKKKWCLSQYENVSQHSLGVFPQAAMDAWKCDLCGSKSGRGFEATFEVIPRLHEINFGSGVIDDLLFLDLPRECRYPSGIMTLEYAKAVQETVYEQLRVVREGQLRIIFTPDLKILAWEFCAQRHEEFLPRRLVAPQVNQLLQVAQKCQSTIAESGSNGVSQQDIQANSAMVVTAGRRLARSLELQSLNDLGFSKTYVRCLQIAEHVNVMKDLMDYCDNQKIGAIEGLKKFPRRATVHNIETQNIQENRILGGQGLPIDRDMLNKLMSLRSSSPANKTDHITGRGAFNSSGHASSSNYQNSLMRQNLINPTHNSMKQEPSSPLITSNQPPTTPRNFQNSNGLLQQNQSQPSIGNQVLQQQMIQQLPSNNKKPGTVPQQPICVKTQVDNGSGNGVGFRSSSGTTDDGNRPGSVEGPRNGSDSSKAGSNGESTVTDCDNGQKGQDLTQNFLVSDEMFQDFMEFSKNGFFDNNNLDDEMKNFSWPDE